MVAGTACPHLTDAFKLLDDEGMEIDRKYAECVFEVFQSPHVGDRTGTSTGLSICDRIVEHHGGDNCVESDPAEGDDLFVYADGRPFRRQNTVSWWTFRRAGTTSVTFEGCLVHVSVSVRQTTVK